MENNIEEITEENKFDGQIAVDGLKSMPLNSFEVVGAEEERPHERKPKKRWMIGGKVTEGARYRVGEGEGPPGLPFFIGEP